MTTRAELLERCQAAGLHATAWRKERMEQELAGLEAARHYRDAQAGTPDLTEADQQAVAELLRPAETEDEKPKRPAPRLGRLSGWCDQAPMWSLSHGEACRPGRTGDCACECHAEDWVRPSPPAGAALSKFRSENAI